MSKKDWVVEAIGIIPFLKVGKLAGPLVKLIGESGELVLTGLKGAGKIGGTACMDFATEFITKVAPSLETAGATVKKFRINIGSNGFIGAAEKGGEQLATTGVHEFIEVTKDGQSIIYDNFFTEGISKADYMKTMAGFTKQEGIITGEKLIEKAVEVK